MNPIRRNVTKLFIAPLALTIAALFASPLAIADNDHDDDYGSYGRSGFSIAVIGDWPYANTKVQPPARVLFDNANLLYNSIHADRSITHVLHVGDIPAGSEPCTGA